MERTGEGPKYGPQHPRMETVSDSNTRFGTLKIGERRMKKTKKSKARSKKKGY